MKNVTTSITPCPACGAVHIPAGVTFPETPKEPQGSDEVENIDPRRFKAEALEEALNRMRGATQKAQPIGLLHPHGCLCGGCCRARISQGQGQVADYERLRP